jgi:hypothetical protein
VDENSHKCAICHHKLKTNNFALKTYHVIVDSHRFQQQISLFIKAHQPMFLTFTAPHLTYLKDCGKKISNFFLFCAFLQKPLHGQRKY